MIFRKKEVTGEPVKDKAAKWIANLLLNMQVKFSEVMNASVRNISLRRLKVMLMVFCILTGGASIYIAADSIFNHQAPLLKPDHIKGPIHLGDEQSDSARIDKNTYQLIVSFEKYLDSLKRTVQGKQIYDSILSARPGLIDSMMMLKNIYQSKNKL